MYLEESCTLNKWSGFLDFLQIQAFSTHALCKTMTPYAHSRALFSRSYAEARHAFLAAARQRGLAVDSHRLALPGAHGEPLATDVVLDGPADASRMVLTISGVHGVEGYCGSAIQCGLLDLGPVVPPDTAMLHVHAINPYGFSHARRATEENVELDCNFVDFDAPLPENAPYAQIHDLLLPPDWPPGEGNEAALGALRREWGPRGYRRAVGQGQYAFPDGMRYGGRAPTWSNRTFRQILRRYARRARDIVSIDIHTGQGAYGVGECIVTCPEADSALNRARRWLGDKVTPAHGDGTIHVPAAGAIHAGQWQECPQARHTNLCLEFGTHPFSVVLPAMRAEQALHRHGAVDLRQAAAIRQAFKDAFYPQADDWQTEVWAQGREVVLQAMEGLQGG